MHLSQSEFEKLLFEAIAELPKVGKSTLDNVAFFVEPEVREAKANEMHIAKGQLLLGLYQGTPQANRGLYYAGALPDKITIFQQPIEMLAGNDETKLKEILLGVVRHEVGHHLGFDEAGIRKHEAEYEQKQIRNIDSE
jgi:predicted Zn-dependent protease with MMP-like domain